MSANDERQQRAPRHGAPTQGSQGATRAPGLHPAAPDRSLKSSPRRGTACVGLRAKAARTLRFFASGAVFLCAVGAAGASESADSVLLRLRHGGEVSCRPTLPYFCENMHVRCSGQTSVPAFPFRLRTTGGAATLELAAAAEDLHREYQDAILEWASDGSHVLLWPRGASGYVKLGSDGKYVFRHYIQSRGVMSLGSCK